MNLTEQIDSFLADIKQVGRYSPDTVKAFTNDLAKLSKHAKNTNLAQLKPAHIRSYIATEHRGGSQPSSLRRVLSSWRKFFDTLIEQQVLTINSARSIRAPRGGKPLPKTLTPDEANVLLSANNGGDIGIRDAAMFEVAYSSALRVSELVGLDDEDIDRSAGLLHVRHGKGSKSRLVPIGKQAMVAVNKWLPVRLSWHSKQDALFTNRAGKRLTVRSVQYRLSRLAQIAEMPSGVNPHMLRHSCASHLLQSSGDLRAVQEFLGHADVTSTQVYTHLDFQALAAVYDRAHPRAKRSKQKSNK